MSRAAATLMGLALCLGTVATIWCVDYVPTGDGPNHILNAYLVNHLDDPAKGYATFLRLGRPVTARGFQLLFTPLESLMEWKTALRTTLTLGALGWALGFAQLVRSLSPRRLALAPLGFATAMNWFLYRGLFPFWLASGLALWVLAYALVPRTRRLELAWMAVLLLLVAVAHVFVAALVGLTILVVTLARESSESRPRALLRMTLVGLPALLVAALSLEWLWDGTSVGAVAQEETLWGSAADRLQAVALRFAGGPWWRALPPAVLAAIGIAMTVAGRAQRSKSELGIATAALVLLVVSYLSPLDLSVWQLFSARFLALALPLGMALVPIERLSERWQHGLLGGLFCFAAASLLWSAAHHRTLATESREALEAAATPLERSGPRLPLIMDPGQTVGHGLPHANTGNLFLLEQGGVSPYLFASDESLHPVVYRAPAEELFPTRFPPRFLAPIYEKAGRDGFPSREEQREHAAVAGSFFEDVILWSSPEDIDAFVARGYVAEARFGRVAVLRYRGCGLRVEVVAGPVLEHAVVIEYGWSPLTTPHARAAAPAGMPVPDGVAKLNLPTAPCGPVWLRVSWDRDGSGNASRGDGFCRGADEHGRLSAVVTHDEPASQLVRCEPAG